MRFLADMGVSLRVADHLRQAGHDVVHLRDEGLQRLPDADVFQKAIGEHRTVLTFDLDFGEIAAHCKGPWASVILFRLADARSEHVAERLDVALTGAADALERGAVVVVKKPAVAFGACQSRAPTDRRTPRRSRASRQSALSVRGLVTPPGHPPRISPGHLPGQAGVISLQLFASRCSGASHGPD